MVSSFSFAVMASAPKSLEDDATKIPLLIVTGSFEWNGKSKNLGVVCPVYTFERKRLPLLNGLTRIPHRLAVPKKGVEGSLPAVLCPGVGYML